MANPEEFEEEDLYEELEGGSRRPWGRRILTALIALAALGGFAMVVVYSYDRGKQAGSADTVPTLVAKEGPTRMKPEDPGGMKIPDQDKKVFGEMNPDEKKAPVERLLPPPEPVMAKPPPEVLKPPAVEMGAKPEMKGAPPVPAPAAPAMAAPVAPPPPPPAPVTKAPPAPKKTPPPEPAKVAAKSPPKAMAPSPGKAYSVQIASFRSRAAANTAWKKLASNNKDLLSGLRADIVQTEIKNRGTWYRLRATPISGAVAARALCNKLKARKVGCFIVRP